MLQRKLCPKHFNFCTATDDLSADPKVHLNKVEKMYIEKDMESKLAEWQRLEAIGTFIYIIL